MIELRYKRMHVYRVSRTRDLVSARVYTYTDQSGGGGGGGRVYEIKTLRSNLAPEEGGGGGGGVYSRGAYNRASTVYQYCMVHASV